MNKFLFLIATLLPLWAQAQYSIGYSENTGRGQGTVVRSWLFRTTTEWEPTSRSFDVSPDKQVRWAGTLMVERVQTQYFHQEVVTQPAHRVWSVVGTTVVNEADPYCLTMQQTDPPNQRRDCPIGPVQKNVEGWQPYNEETQEVDGGSQRTTVERRPIKVSVNLSGQVLRDYEQESLTVNVDENAQVSASVSNAKNNYQIATETTSPQTAVVVVRGQGRNLSPEDGATPDAIFAEGGEPHVYQSSDNPGRIFVKFKLSDRVFDPQYDPNLSLRVTYQVEQTDGLSQYSTEFKKANARTVVVDANRQQDNEIDMWGAGRARRVRAHLYFNIDNSKWYSSRTFEASAAETTAK